MSVDAIDRQWFDRIEPAMSFANEIEGKLRVPAAELQGQAAIFRSSDHAVAPLLTPSIDMNVLVGKRAELQVLREDIGERASPQIAAAYLPRIGELGCNLDMLEGAATGNTELFMSGNLRRFGEPDPQVFASNLAVLRGVALNARGSNGVIDEQARRMLDITPDVDLTPTFTEGQLSVVRSVYKGVLDSIEESLSDVQWPLQGEETLRVTQQVVDRLGYDYRSVPQAKGLSTAAVYHDAKEVRMPLTEQYWKERFLGITGHEIWIHVAEAMNGAEQPLLLVRRGLDRMLFATEGKGLSLEMAVYSSHDAFMQTPRALEIARRMTAIGLARGLMDGEHKGFAEVFDVINGFDRLIALTRNGEDQQAADQSAFDKTWELLTQRTQKGVTGGKGMASLQDKVYAEGVGPQIRLVAEYPEVFPHLNKGKYDLTNASHVRVLKMAGVIPHELFVAPNA